MTIRFAAATRGDSAAIARALTVLPVRQAANDNSDVLARDALLRATLRHFAEFGLGAAEQANRNAQRAFFAGDRDQYRRWLDICRALDRRMADAIEAQRNERGG